MSSRHVCIVGISLLYWYIRQYHLVGHLKFSLLVSNSFSVPYLYFKKDQPSHYLSIHSPTTSSYSRIIHDRRYIYTSPCISRVWTIQAFTNVIINESPVLRNILRTLSVCSNYKPHNQIIISIISNLDRLFLLSDQDPKGRDQIPTSRSLLLSKSNLACFHRQGPLHILPVLVASWRSRGQGNIQAHTSQATASRK